MKVQLLCENTVVFGERGLKKKCEEQRETEREGERAVRTLSKKRL